MLKVVESNGVLEIRTVMTAGMRLLLVLFSLVPLLAPYELILVPDWQDYFNVYFVFVLIISVGALAVSAFLVWAAIAGLNSRLSFDRAEGTFTYSAAAPVVRMRSFRYPMSHVADVQVKEHDWSDGPPSFSLRVVMADQRAFDSGSTWSREEIEAIRQKVSSFLSP